jgi:aminoglycoside phosphotransferase (APT) family kinase protein
VLPADLLERAIHAVEPRGELIAAHPLTGGVSAEIVAIDVRTPSGATTRSAAGADTPASRRVVVRRPAVAEFKGDRRSTAAREFAVLRFLHTAGLPVPEPLHLESDADGPWLVIEWIDGTTTVPGDRVAEAVDQMAGFLAALHAIDPAAVDGVDPVEDPLASIPPFLPDSPAGDRLRTTIAGGSVERRPNPACLLHGDYWPGNVMWRDGMLVAVVDWEDAALGDPLADLATARVELLCQLGPDAMERFTRSYHEQRTWPLDRTDLALWECYVSSASLTSMHRWGLPPADEARRRAATTAFFERAADDVHGKPSRIDG